MSGNGFGIVYASILHPDCQNLVIRDCSGAPVAKATAYVNRKNGYLVFNTIQASVKLGDKQLDEVYNQFLLGTYAFADKYNARFPKNPLKIITVGMNLNSLESQIKKTKQETPTLEGLDFGKYGEFMHDYPGDWNKKGQYKIWEKSDCDGVKHGRQK